jgi:hypothetical protein
MARERHRDPDDELDDDDGDWQTDEGDLDDEYEPEDDASAVESCPYCGKDVYEGAEMCPHCRSYISEEDAPASRSAARIPRWMVIVIVAALVAVFSGATVLMLMMR